jgi:threonine/homoserine/homoserine lactone efflux protein
MGEAIGEVVGLAVGVAISPVPIAAVILMMFSERARANSAAFMVAWIAGIAVVATVVTLIPGLEADGGEPGSAAGWVKLVLGLLLILVALRQWRSRPGAADEPELPAWMARIDTLKAGAAFGLGFLLSAANPKNLLLAVAAGAAIGSAGLTSGETAVVLAVFTGLAALTVIVPVVGFLLAGGRLDRPLDATKDWLIRNNSVVMAVLLVVLGFNLLGDGLSILA